MNSDSYGPRCTTNGRGPIGLLDLSVDSPLVRLRLAPLVDDSPAVTGSAESPRGSGESIGGSGESIVRSGESI
eukprot:CAMPEP_0198231882 /NCGR_PEP_ID=MMETSP1445-20131203/115435_1 /TAXON_ID=36898 /ORGANISM="Pyramimonas sp., Strain CCMP2087" /LENGTH=72 /DNA_ID=CAMNT_0043912523 /DNA_START=661 /DNA_END=876 /DNA_ORIENTATION=-